MVEWLGLIVLGVVSGVPTVWWWQKKRLAEAAAGYYTWEMQVEPEAVCLSRGQTWDVACYVSLALPNIPILQQPTGKVVVVAAPGEVKLPLLSAKLYFFKQSGVWRVAGPKCLKVS